MKEHIDSICEEVNKLRIEEDEDKIKINDIKTCIDKLSQSVTKKDIADMRWTILNFANQIKNGQAYDSEAYNHIIEVYDDYESLLRENKMENGRVDMGMRLIREHYERGMRDGFPV